MKNRPNILFLMSDQHNANCLGVTGKRNVRTPNLDALAKSGVRFERAYCNNPICSPSRISYFTGQYPHTHGMIGNNNYDFKGDTPDTMAMLFRKYGYQTALIGKSHMVGKWDREGFEHIRYCDLTDADSRDVLTNHYFKYLVDHGLGDMYEDGSIASGSEYHKKHYGVADLPYEHSIEHWTGEETLKFLKNRDGRRPFFAHMSFERPHPNWRIAPELLNMYKSEDIILPECKTDAYEHEFASKPEYIRKILLDRRVPQEHLRKILAIYYTLITAIDAEIGRVFKYLKDKGEFDNTIIVYVADHGDFGGDHGLYDKNVGIYESIHRIPFILKYPGCKKKVVDDAIIESIDLYSTFCHLCDIPVPEHVEGESIIPIINNNAPGREFALAEWDWSPPHTRINAIRTKDFRLVYYGGETGGELYHNAEDPGEIYNLWNDPDYLKIRAQLMEMLFEQVAKYAKRTTKFLDKQKSLETKTCITNLIHKRCRKWSDVKKMCYD